MLLIESGPGQAQHQNGQAHPIPPADDGKKSAYTLIETVMLEADWLINIRPIAVRYAAEDNVVPMSPNNILLGRSHRLRLELELLSQLPKEQGITGF